MSPDVLCLCETWLSSNDTNILPDIGYYTKSQAAQKNGNHGGVAKLVRDGLNLAAWDCTLPDFDFACGTVLSTDPQILILSVYNPPPHQIIEYHPHIYSSVWSYTLQSFCMIFPVVLFLFLVISICQTRVGYLTLPLPLVHRL